MNNQKQITLIIIKPATHLITSVSSDDESGKLFCNLRGSIRQETLEEGYFFVSAGIRYQICHESALAFLPYLKAAVRNNSCLEVFARLEK